MFTRALLPLEPGQDLASIKDILHLTNHLGTKSFHLVHILTSGLGKKEQLASWLAGMVEELQAEGFSATYQVIPEGHPATEIYRTADRENVDYIYLPANRRNIIQRTLLGSTSQDVIRLTHKPTLIHKNRPDPKQPHPVQSLLYATDFAAAASRAFPYAKTLAAKAEKMLLLHAGQRGADPQAEISRQQYVQAELDQLRKRLAADIAAPIIETYAGIGAAHRLIQQQAEKRQVDIIVLGRFNANPWLKALGSTAEKIIGAARCSLLLIP
jgi:nucleotide-binding universal stress UspA family protein